GTLERGCFPCDSAHTQGVVQSAISPFDPERLLYGAHGAYHLVELQRLYSRGGKGIGCGIRETTAPCRGGDPTTRGGVVKNCNDEFQAGRTVRYLVNRSCGQIYGP